MMVAWNRVLVVEMEKKSLGLGSYLKVASVVLADDLDGVEQMDG